MEAILNYVYFSALPKLAKPELAEPKGEQEHCFSTEGEPGTLRLSNLRNPFLGKSCLLLGIAQIS